MREILASGYQISVFKATWSFAQGVCDSPGAMRCEVTSPLLQGSDPERDGRRRQPHTIPNECSLGARASWFGGSIRSMFPSTSARPANRPPAVSGQNARHRACALHRSPRRLRAQTPQRQHGLTSEQQGRLRFPHYVIGVMLDQLERMLAVKGTYQQFHLRAVVPRTFDDACRGFLSFTQTMMVRALWAPAACNIHGGHHHRNRP